MNTKILSFSKKTMLELLREPLSYIFCCGFPVVMLVIMSVINSSIPPEAGMTTFQIQNLAPGIIVFGLTFVMLFTALTVSKDRSSALLVRLYASPMKSYEYISGYCLPVILVALLQAILTYVAAIIIGLIVGYEFSFIGILLSLLIMLPSAVLLIGFGLLFGTLFNEKAAPGLCSIIICLAGMLGGIWMDVDGIGGVLAKVAKALPFYHSVATMRSALTGAFSAWGSLCVVLIYAVVICAVACAVFNSKMHKDSK